VVAVVGLLPSPLIFCGEHQQTTGYGKVFLEMGKLVDFREFGVEYHRP
jgi:hypothetical protein